MIILTIASLTFSLFLLTKLYIKKRQEHALVSILTDCLNNKMDTIIDENINSQISMLLNNLQENQLYLVESSLEEHNKLQSLISDLSHQLKTPLTNLKMYQSFLDEDDLSIKEIQKFKEKMRAQMSKIEWVIHSLINCMRLEENIIDFSAEALPVKPTIVDAIDSVQFSADLKEINLKLSPQFDHRILVCHNYNWTREVLINILDNAIKYSPPRSNIDIHLEETEMYTVICVSDQGMGIHTEEINQIFQRFYRSPDTKSIEGSGIGLYLSRLILEKEHAYITVESTVKKGSTFKIWLENT